MLKPFLNPSYNAEWYTGILPESSTTYMKRKNACIPLWRDTKDGIITKIMSVKQNNRMKFIRIMYSYIVKILKKIDGTFENFEKLKEKLEFVTILVYIE